MAASLFPHQPPVNRSDAVSITFATTKEHAMSVSDAPAATQLNKPTTSKALARNPTATTHKADDGLEGSGSSIAVTGLASIQ